MRPYQILIPAELRRELVPQPPTDPWIDLDTIQSINPPTFVDRMGHGGYFIEMAVFHAFQDSPRIFSWAQPGEFVQGHGFRGPERTPERTPEGEPTVQALVRKEVYEPLLRAWMGEVPEEKAPVPLTAGLNVPLGAEHLEDFNRWWNKHGQFCRAGGGSYERTFAYEAWKAALKLNPGRQK